MLLVGGASQIVGLKEALEAVLLPGQQVHRWNMSDYAVALGRAIVPRRESSVFPIGAPGSKDTGLSAPAAPSWLAVTGDRGGALLELVCHADKFVKDPSGEYRIPQPLVVDKPLEIEGWGRERTVIRWEGEGPAIICRGNCQLTLRGVTIERVGQQAGELLDADAAQVTIEESRIVGARSASGVRLRGNTRADIRRCLIDGHDLYGIVLEDSAEAVLENNSCEKNGDAGIRYGGDSRGVAKQNMCQENQFSRISVDDQAAPEIQENTCQQNGGSGICYAGASGGTARMNICRENVDGVLVVRQAAPQLEENTCQQNGYAGIRYAGAGGGSARKNICRKNKLGIMLDEQAVPLLENNTCEENGEVGICYDGAAGGIARNNVCAHNRNGIRVSSSGKIELDGNHCHSNSGSGIYLKGASVRSTRLVRNTCEKNRYGIRIGFWAWSTNSSGTKQLHSGQLAQECESFNPCQSNEVNWLWSPFFDLFYD